MKNARMLATDDGGDSYFRRSKELTEEYKDNAQAGPHRKDENGDGEIVCCNCLHGGILLCCCGKECRRRYHPSCLDPPLNYIPPGFWHCIWCVKKKIKLGVHSVSEGVESILDSREVVSKDKVMQREYFVKYHGLAHAHNCWIPETQMLLEAPKLLAKFKRKQQVIRWKKDWSIPHRLLLKRPIILSKQNDQHFDGHNDNDSICRYEWLVKWTGLGYDHVTWELDDASFMTSPKGMKLRDDYESRQKKPDGLKNPFEANEERKASFAEISVLSSGDSPGFYNQHLSYVNRLRKYWQKGQSALIVDDQIDQERVMKVILFILSLNCNVKRPFLIISTSTSLSVWETEFLHLAPSANLVVYKGNKDVRSGIRALEFYNEDGGILFEILLSTSDIIVEDLHELRCISWEAIIIDECQRSRILGHFDNIKVLAAEMRLLLVSGQIKEDRADYIKLLSFLKSGHHELNIAQMETCLSASISNLKSQLEHVAFKCNSGHPRFVEYWVPAQLSRLQLEQYCSMLLSNSMLLCSGQKSDSVNALRDLVISTTKCCNHPYLLDQSLHNFVTRGLPVEEHLDIGIKASGKLQLLEKFLFEARSRQLRVIILFQSSGGSGSIGNILDDVLCQRFGKDCYVRYGRGYVPSKKQAALDAFNDRESGKFVFLMENRACLPSIKLSSVDTIILFDSDWDPQNDLRCLQRMSISSQFKQLTVFRLYSSFTVEEKVLMLAKEGIALDSNLQLINQSTTYQTLLKWGASHLFSKLDDLHGNGSSVSAPDISDQSILSDVICELSSKLVCGSGDTDCLGQSFISRVQQNGGEYARNILLLGEREIKKLGNEPHAFSWSDLLKGRDPHWKFLSVSSQRIRKTVKHFDHILKESERESHDIIRKRRTEPEDYVYPKRKKMSTDNVDPKGRKAANDNVDPKKRKVSKSIVDTKGKKLSKDVVDPKTREGSKDIDAKRRLVFKVKWRALSKDSVDSKSLKKKLKNKKNPSAGNRASELNGNGNGLSKVLDSKLHPLTNEITGAAVMNKQFSKQKKLPDMPKSTKLLPKSDISHLCDVLHFPKNVKAVSMRILEHIFKHYNVNCQDVSTVQAFEISVCWLAASLLKHKIDKKDSLDLAKRYLNFNCKEEEATDVYSELWKYKMDFSSFLQNGPCVEKSNITGASDSKTPELNDLVEEEKQMSFQGPHVLNLVKSGTNEHDPQRNSPTTVLSSQDQTNTEKFHSGPHMVHEICLSQNKPGSLPLEEDATSMESDADERINAMTSITAEVPFLEHRNKVPNSSNDPNNVVPVTGSLEGQSPLISTEIAQSDCKVSEDPQILVNEVIDIDNSMDMSTRVMIPNPSNDPNIVDPVTGSMERQSPVISTEIAQSDCKVSEDPQILMNEVIDIDNSMDMSARVMNPNSSNDPNIVDPVTGSMERQSPVISTEIAQSDCKVSEDPQILMNEVIDIDNSVDMSTHPVQLNSVETNAVTCDSTAVPEVREWNSIASPVCGESTALEFAESTLPYMQPSHANLVQLPQMSLSAIQSFLEDDLSGTVMSLSAIQSFLEDDLSSTVMPLDDFVYHSGRDRCNNHGDGVILQAPIDPAEPVNSSFISPDTLQPSTYVPVNENATHGPHSISNPGYINNDHFQAHSVTSEMPHNAYPDPLLIELERIEMMNEEAFKIHEKKRLQLQSDYKKEFQNLAEKYCMLLQNINTEVELKGKELEKQCELVLMNMVLAEAWIQKLDGF